MYVPLDEGARRPHLKLNRVCSFPITFATGATDWQKTEQGISNPNENYGTIATVNGSEAFTVFVYTSTWEIANPAIGWYRPYADYASAVTFSETDGRSAGSSNIAIVVRHNPHDSSVL